MNTGIQDAHNLAWKLYGALKSPGCGRSGSLLESYGLERRPIARSNASLSGRNYERSLNIARSIGLDADHPKLVADTVGGADKVGAQAGGWAAPDALGSGGERSYDLIDHPKFDLQHRFH